MTSHITVYLGGTVMAVQVKVGVCKSCGSRGKLQPRGLCSPCYRAAPAEHPGRKWRTDTPEQISAAKARESEYLEFILPRVIRYARKCFRSAYDREALVADCCGVSWLLFLRTVADGRDPMAEAHLIVRRSR